MPTKITQKIADQRDLLKNIKRVGKFIGPKCKTEYICPVCKNIWMARPDNIWYQNSKSCSKCAKNKLLDCNEIFFDKISSEQAYILGFLVTDGNIRNEYGSKRIKIKLGIKDEKHLICIKNLLCPQSNILYYDAHLRGKSYKHCQIRFTSSIIYDYLVSIGFSDNKTWNPPNLFPIIPKKYHWDYIRGIIDGDGCIFTKYSKTGGLDYCLSIVSASKRFLSTIKKNIGYGYMGQNSYSKVHVYRIYKRKDIIDLCEKIYSKPNCLKLNRKYQKYLEIKNYADSKEKIQGRDIS